MRTYQKPETEIVLLTASQNVLHVVDTSTTTAPVGGDDDPDDPDLSNRNSVWDLWEDEKE